MASLADYRAKYPQYEDMSDQQLADGLHAKFYADMPKEEFYGKVGYSAAPAAPEAPKKAPSLLEDINTGFEQAADWATMGLFGNYRAAVDTLGAKTGAPGFEKNEDAKFLETKEANREKIEDFNQRRPIAGVVTKTVGGVAPTIVSGGASLASRAATAPSQLTAREAARVVEKPVVERAATIYEQSKRPLGVLGRRAADVVKGGQYGAIVGANEAVGKGDDPAQQREDIAINTGIGMAAGPVVGALGEGLARVGRKAQPVLKEVLKDESGMATFGDFDRIVTPKAPTKEAVARENLKLAKQAGISPRDMMETGRAYREAGTQPLFAELLKRRGLQRARNLANMPGKTPDVAEKVIAEEHSQQVRLLRNATEDAVAADPRVKPRSQMQKNLETTRVRVGDKYDPLFEKAGTTINPEAQPDIAAALQRIPDSVMDDAIAAMEQRSTWRGADPQNISEPRKLWYIKKHLDTVIAKLEKNQDSMLPDVIRTQKMLIDGLEKGIPGYKALNSQYAEVKNAQDALKWGQSILETGRASESPEEVSKAFKAMTKRQKAAAKSGLMADMKRMIEEGAGAPDAPRNAASFLKGTGPDKVRAILGLEADPMMRKIAVLSQGYRNRSFMRPGSGSNTFASQAEAEEMFLTHPPTKQRLTKMFDEAMGAGWTRATSPWRERVRDMQGEQLFSKMSEEDIARIAMELEANYAARRNAGIVSRSAGATGALGGQNRENRQ